MKIKALLYCTKQPHKLYATDKGYVIADCELGDYYSKKEKINGKIVAECDFEVEEINCSSVFNHCYTTWNLGQDELLKFSCLERKQLVDYLGYENQIDGKWCGYAIHIENLKIFDKPRELSDYYKFDGVYNDINNWKTIDKAPQNMMYAYDLISELGFSGTYNMQLIKKVLISIRPEWLCKILNGEKTIEVRKKVLKEMVR